MDIIKRFNDYIYSVLESLNSNIDIDWIKSENEIYGYFYVNDIKYRLEFIKQIGNNWSYSFSYEKDNKYLYEIPTELRFDGFKVLSAVKNGLYYLYELIKPNSIIFSAIDSSDTRKRLYKNFCKSFSDDMNLNMTNRGTEEKQVYLLFDKKKKMNL
jgi:hypothetical protein